MSNLTVAWGTCGDDSHWCDFLNLDLSTDHFKELKGVYIIGNADGVVRVGSGIIKDRITAHRNDKEITAYKNLKITWAQVNANQMEGVEKFLADHYDPKVGERFPDRTPISVNLPKSN
ncbi:MAG TPA: hypothetical protein PLU37_13640 [Chitinophagaceae bacterium]|nr:hypothetical protein [Chitinophagaceae bacterium]